MSEIVEKLTEAGIHPYGSEALKTYEERITRYLAREYQRQKSAGHTLESLGVSTDKGPMWE